MEEQQQRATLRDLLGFDVTDDALDGLIAQDLTNAAALEAVCSGSLPEAVALLMAKPTPGLTLGAASRLYARFKPGEQHHIHGALS